MGSEFQDAINREYQQAMQETVRKRKKRLFAKIVITTILLIVGIGAAMLWRTYCFGVRLQMLGDAQIIQEYQETFTDPGATACFDGIFYDVQTIPVKMEGTVDTEQLGTYELIYTSEYEIDFYFFTLTCQTIQNRSVAVVDTKAPEIQLITDPSYFTLPGATYQEEGFTAIDNYDGDLTAAVTRTETKDQITYRVADSSGNVTEVTRPVVYSDPVAPELKLVGAPVVMLRLGKTYTEPGFVALDNVDGDVTEKVTVNGTVDGNTIGTYVIEYSVQDTSGNIATVTRKVIVDNVKQVADLAKMPDQTPVEPNGKVVYLTFDDGPSIYTSHLLDALDKYEVKASFFVVRADNADILKRMDASGHTVGMHSDTHNYGLIYSSEEAYLADLYAVQSKIEAAIGYKPMLLRFPGGSSNTVSRLYCKGVMTAITQKVKELGFRYFDWNGDSRDVADAKDANDVYRNVAWCMAGPENSVILQHDIVDFSVAAVEDILKWGLINGYTFKALTMDSPTCEFRVQN